MTSLKISTIIPAYNAAAYLRDAINSVLAQERPVELVVVNDGSTDETAAIIESYGHRLQAIHQKQLGLGVARNRGLEACRGGLVAFLDADDCWTRDKISLQARVLEQQNDLDMVFGHCTEFSSSSSDSSWVVRTQPFPAISACAMLARRSLFNRIGGFSESRNIGEFIDWYSRALTSGAKACMLKDVVFHRRVHDANMTRTASNRSGQYLGVLRSHLQRQRDKS